MKTPALRSALWFAPLALAACNNKPEVVGGPPDPMGNQIASAPPVDLPPSISASVTYRCTDNSLVSVDWFTGNTEVTLHPTKTGAPVHLKAEKAGGPFTAAGGYKLSGDQKKIKWNEPGKPDRSCHL